MFEQAGASGIYSFLAVYGEGTLRFDATPEQVHEVVEAVGSKAQDPEFRQGVREAIRTGLIDNDHVHPVRGQELATLVLSFCLTSPVRLEGERRGYRGFILAITDKGGGETNFPVMIVPGKAEVDEYCAKARRAARTVVAVSAEEAAKALQAKRKGKGGKVVLPPDPSRNPPARPRPDRFMEALERTEKVLGPEQFQKARECLEQGACFVFRARQIADESQEEIDASLAAMVEHDRFHLPFPRIWVETRDRIEFFSPEPGVGMTSVDAHIGIAAYEDEDGTIGYFGFADTGRGPVMSALRAELDREAFAKGSRFIAFNPPRIPPELVYSEGGHRAISRVAGDRLLEVLFLLSTKGVEKQRVEAGAKPPGMGAKRNPRKAKHRKRERERDYTIVRVPLVYDPEAAGPATGGNGGRKGRWVRPHVRRAHMWGKNMRPIEEQHWREAVLVGAEKLGENEKVKRPEYVIG